MNKNKKNVQNILVMAMLSFSIGINQLSASSYEEKTVKINGINFDETSQTVSLLVEESRSGPPVYTVWRSDSPEGNFERLLVNNQIKEIIKDPNGNNPNEYLYLIYVGRDPKQFYKMSPILYEGWSIDEDLQEYGTEEEEISELQVFLWERGYLDIDITRKLGTFLYSSVKALKKFQEDVGIYPASGKCDLMTRAVINSGVEKPPLEYKIVSTNVDEESGFFEITFEIFNLTDEKIYLNEYPHYEVIEYSDKNSYGYGLFSYAEREMSYNWFILQPREQNARFTFKLRITTFSTGDFYSVKLNGLGWTTDVPNFQTVGRMLPIYGAETEKGFIE